MVSERHDRQYELEAFEEEKQEIVRSFEKQLYEERVLRVDAETKARDELSEEIDQTKAGLQSALRREEEYVTKLNALDIKVGMLQSERSELLADRDAAKSLLAAHEEDMNKLEQSLLSLQVEGTHYLCAFCV